MDPNDNCFYVQDNFEKPFRVIIDQEFSDLKVYKMKYPIIGFIDQESYEKKFNKWKEHYHEDSDEDGEELAKGPKRKIESEDPVYEDLVLHITKQNDKLKVFIGGSESSNPLFFGNSFLFQKNETRWIWIGYRIFEFEPLSTIVDYKSPIFNSNVAYPYAIDDLGNYYLMIENVILKNIKEKIEDPYKLYYQMKSKNYKKESLYGYPSVEPLFGKIVCISPIQKDKDPNIVIACIEKVTKIMLQMRKENSI